MFGFDGVTLDVIAVESGKREIDREQEGGEEGESEGRENERERLRGG